ncbi:MAG: hypothetical protein CMO60_03485 [Verrucomicrobiales bacterium]|nr:hypothetical protein [Verrucomicrobiales bacterium]
MKWIFLLLTSLSLSAGEKLFDGTTLKGWQVQKGEERYWKVRGGVIVGGSMTEKVAHNTFITTVKRYGDFELRLKAKVEGPRANAGIQIRSERIENHHEMIGYQADIGKNIWGRLYDESRRRSFLIDWASKDGVKAAKEGWNDYIIRCEGSRIRLWVNGTLTCDYTEKDEKIPLKGFIALQAHSGPPFEASYKGVEIEEL